MKLRILKAFSFCLAILSLILCATVKICAAPATNEIGIEIDEEACLAHPYKPHTLRHYTGALTDIRPPESKFYF